MKFLFSLEQYAKSLPRYQTKRKLSESSQFGKRLIELRKLFAFYGKPSQKYLRALYKKSDRSSQKSSSFFRLLESRLDVVLFRAHFFESIASAKQQISIGRVEVNNKKVISPKYRLLPGDVIQVVSNVEEKTCSSSDKDTFSADKTSFTKKLRKKSGWRFQRSPFFLSLLMEQFKKVISCKSDISASNILCVDKILPKIDQPQEKLKNFAKSPKTNKFKTKGEDKTNVELTIGETPGRFFKMIAFRKNVLAKSSRIPFLANQKFAKEFSIADFSSRLSLENVYDFGILACLRDLSRKKQAVIKEGKENSDVLNKQSKKSQNWLFLMLLVLLKKQAISSKKKSLSFFSQKNQPFFKSQSLFRAKRSKPLHLEISYKSRAIIFLFPPQRICFANYIDLSQIAK